MKVLFSCHATQRMQERKISRNEVLVTLGSPDRSGQQGERSFAMKTRKNGHLLIVYYIYKSGTAKIITVITTSKISKYLS